MKLDCSSRGDRPITIAWFKGTQEISKTRSERYEIFETLTDNGVKSELLIRSADREDGQVYQCKAENSYGKDEKSSKLLVLEVPAAPTNLILHEVWSRTASISWSTPFSGNTPITGYIIQFWRESNSGENKRLLEETITSSATSYMLRNLEPGAVYEVSVTATNDVGRGMSSNVVKFKTGEEEPSSPPLDVTAEPKGPTTLRLSWKPPLPEKCHGHLLGFYVGFKHVIDYNKPYSYRTVPAGSFNQTYEYFLTGLKKGTDYNIIVKAFNSAGSGVDSQEILAKTTLGDVPAAPKVFLFPVTSNSVSLLWKVSHDEVTEAKLVGYSVHYRPEYSTVWKEINVPVEAAGPQQEFSIKDLESNTLYHFYVTASNAFGAGDPSPILTVKTRGVEDESTITGNVMTHPGVTGMDKTHHQFRMEMTSFISITVAAVIVIVVIIISYVCIKKAHLSAGKPQLSATYAEFLATTIGRAGGSDGDNKSVYMGPHHRYVEFDAAGRPVKQGNMAHVMDAQGNVFPAPYASLSVPANPTPAVSLFLFFLQVSR